MKREKAEPLLDDVSLCVQMSWTWDELMRQPVRFVERLRVYMDALADRELRERQRLDDEIEKIRRMGR